jgi:hypothetical protein
MLSEDDGGKGLLLKVSTRDVVGAVFPLGKVKKK